MIKTLAIFAAAAVIVLALVALALRRQARRGIVRSSNSITLAQLEALSDAARRAAEPEPSWWVLGALSDARRNAAEPEALEEPAIWHELLADWPRLRALVAGDDIGPHGGTGFSVAGHAHQALDALTYDRFQLAEVPA